MVRAYLNNRATGGAVKLPHIKGEVCWGWVSLLVLFSATEKRIGKSPNHHHFTIFQSKNLYLSDKNSKFADGNVKSLING